MRKQYHFRPSPNGYFAWDIDRLVELTKDLEVRTVPLNVIQELDEPYWFGDEDVPTCRAVIEHARLIGEADLRYPIILSKDGRVMDGMHRVGKAVLRGYDSIKAVQFEEDPEPDYTDVVPGDLPY
jgi:hypothetical protein